MQEQKQDKPADPAHGEAARFMKFDRANLARHQALLAFVKKTRARYDEAAIKLKGKPNGIAAIEKLQKAQQKAIEAQQKALRALDPDGTRSRLTGNHELNLNYLLDEYPANVVGLLAGDEHPLAEVRSEMDEHQKKIEDWIAELKRPAAGRPPG